MDPDLEFIIQVATQWEPNVRHWRPAEEWFVHVTYTFGHERGGWIFCVSRFVKNVVCWFSVAARKSPADRAARTADMTVSEFRRPHVLGLAPSEAATEGLFQAPLLGLPTAIFLSSYIGVRPQISSS